MASASVSWERVHAPGIAFKLPNWQPRLRLLFRKQVEKVQRQAYHAPPMVERRYDKGGPNSFTRMARELSFAEKYGSYKSTILVARAGAALRDLGADMDDVRQLKGINVLDIGCGARDRKDRLFEPWIARAFHAAGMRVTGIDIRPQANEPFSHHQKDLALRGALDFLPSGSFDIVACILFLDLCDVDDGATAPVLLERKSRQEREEMKSEIVRQVKRLLRDGGRLEASYDGYPSCFVKKGGMLVLLEAGTLLETGTYL